MSEQEKEKLELKYRQTVEEQGRSNKEKPLYSLRLEELLHDKGLHKYQLAELIHTSPQTISKACNGIRLTKATVDEIVKLYPEYNASWLLGYDTALKYVADQEKRDASFKELYEILIGERKTPEIEKLYKERNAQRLADIKRLIPVIEYSGLNAELLGDNYLTVFDNEKNYDSFRFDKLTELEEDIKAFLKYRLQKLMEKGR